MKIRIGFKHNVTETQVKVQVGRNGDSLTSAGHTPDLRCVDVR